MCVKEYQFTSGNRGIFSDSEYLFDNYVLRYKSVEKCQNYSIMKRFFVVNLSLFCLFVLCNVIRLYGQGDYFCLYLHQKKLCGVGKTDCLN